MLRVEVALACFGVKRNRQCKYLGAGNCKADPNKLSPGYQVCSVWLPLDPITEEVSVEVRLWQPPLA